MKKRIIIGILIAALVAGGSAGGAVYYKKSHQKTVSVVSVDNLAGSNYQELWKWLPEGCRCNFD